MQNDRPFNLLIIVFISGFVIVLGVFTVKIIEHLFNDRAARNFLVDRDSALTVVFATDLVLIILTEVANNVP